MTLLVALACLFGFSGPLPASDEVLGAWTRNGPPGGDVHSLAVDPGMVSRVYLGAAGGLLYRTEDGGDLWRRTVPGFPRRDQVLEALVVTATGTLVAGFWDVHGRGGGVAVSRDRGDSFEIALDGESVRSLALAPSDPEQIVAGTLSGVFASADSGRHWARISPVGDHELRGIESVAVDPKDSRVIYAGTRHLPWKTTDRGVTWAPAHAGMIDDSDVFSITVDPENPRRLHASACSGIYVSENGAATWSRIQGIPFGSRRTRAFARDSLRPDLLYAGTTEGLWLSDGDPLRWRLVTERDFVVNALAVLPDGVVLAGGDGRGVLRSRDHGRSWQAANEGLSERPVSSLAFGPKGEILAAMRGDRNLGGVFVADQTGSSWIPLGRGLEGREVRSIAASRGRLLAGTDRGPFEMDITGGRWSQAFMSGDLGYPYPAVNAVALLRGAVGLAGTAVGLSRSDAVGQPWRSVLTGVGEVTAVVLSSAGRLSLAATADALYASRDEGREWRRLPQRPGTARVNEMIVVGDGAGPALVATGAGLYRSIDGGESWLVGGWGLPDSDFTGLAATPDGATVFISDFAEGGVYRSRDLGVTWQSIEAPGPTSERVWTLGVDPANPRLLWGGATVGGLRSRQILSVRP